MNIIRLYNQNRKQLFILILIIAFIIGVIHFANYIVKKDNLDNSNNKLSSSSTGSATTTYNPKQSAISSETVSNSTFKKQSEVIDNFVKYCNEGNKEQAYDLLSKDCKEVLFPTLEYFINDYYKLIFNEPKIYSIQNWSGSTYKIRLLQDILATGKSNNSIATEDYYTLVNENKEYKLNINGFVSRTEVNRKKLKNGIEISAQYMDKYMDKIVYVVNVKNDTNNTILLDSGETSQNMYIMDSNNVKYVAHTSEIPYGELIVLPNATNTIKIGYTSSNIKGRRFEYMVFKDIILDYNTYSSYILKGNYTDRVSIQIDL